MRFSRAYLRLAHSSYLPATTCAQRFTPKRFTSNINMSTIATAASLDHLVLTVKDLNASIKFYEKFLGMKHISFTSSGVERHALSFGSQKINLHASGKEFEPKAQKVQPGSGDLCFLVEDPIEQVLDRLNADGVHVLEGGKVVDRTGARGKLQSVYIRDPDGNLIELSNMVETEIA